MPSLLEELYAGHMVPVEMIVSRDPRYRPVCRQISDLTEYWRKKLGEEDFCELENLLDLYAKANTMHAAAVFSHGFKLGAALFAEVYAGKDELVQEHDR
ncbi:DUF6809 family protein [Paenibacillus phoenicis]|uniref:DUF6809 family protein n=1 Tax=Paenibacillus phoenicis TaxID=554117 RepID=UPI003D2B95CC